mmetsp:Transcript_19446/g.18566  ORF Transcript_19446/g.18566 Transcript_19446/m.18566 type:complete len:135 (+) Transcript_19446:933-1337(+)
MVFNIQHTNTNLKQFLMDLEHQEHERLQKLKITEEKMDEAIGNTWALKFLAQNAENQKFKNKRQEELEKVQTQQVHTTALIRVRFPDDYCIQGTFGALEKIQDVYNFVQENLATPTRQFYLYVTPPKKELKEMN